MKDSDLAPRYGAGKSQFYAEADLESHEKVNQLASVKPATNNDRTVYLSKSTFYDTSQHCRAKDCPYFGNPATQNFCSACYRDMILALTKSTWFTWSSSLYTPYSVHICLLLCFVLVQSCWIKTLASFWTLCSFSVCYIPFFSFMEDIKIHQCYSANTLLVCSIE